MDTSYKILRKAVLAVAGDTITLSDLPPTGRFFLITNLINSGSIIATLRFNNDSGANYAYRSSENGGADATTVSSTRFAFSGIGATFPVLTRMYITNIMDQQKLINSISTRQNTAGAANIPGRSERVGKWVNTTAQITRIDIINEDTGDFAAGSNVILLGLD